MEITQLKYFLEVAATQHITKSADKLHIAQPALTQAIHRLEDDLGVKLFEHAGRNIVLTTYGKYLMDTVAPIVDRLDKLPGELRHMAKTDKATIRINVLAASSLVTEAIVEYKKQHNVNFSVLQSSSDVSDIEVTTRIMYQVSRERRDSEFVIAEKIFLAMPESRAPSSIRLRDVTDEGFISLVGSKQFRAICDKFCHHVGFKPSVIFESDNPSAVRNVIAAGVGVGFWPEFTWGDVRGEGLRLVEITDAPCKRDIVLLCRSLDNNVVSDFYSFLKRFFVEKKRAALS